MGKNIEIMGVKGQHGTAEATDLLYKIQTHNNFSRFEFTLGKNGESLLVACYGEHPNQNVTGKPLFIRYQDMITDIYPICHSWDLYTRLYLTLEPNHSARIDDIETPQINKGYGSVAWFLTEEVLRQFTYHKVSGWLSPVDIEHRDRQVHFYKKLGFTVHFAENNSAVIRKRLDT